MYIEGKRGRGRPKKRRLDVIEIDMRNAGVSVEDADCLFLTICLGTYFKKSTILLFLT